MNRSSSNWSGRTHRSMNAAFGPYCDRRLHPMPEQRRPFGARVWEAVQVALWAAAIGVGLFMYLSEALK